MRPCLRVRRRAWLPCSLAAMREWRRSCKGRPHPSWVLQARIEKVLDVSIAREVEKLESSLWWLATVASAGPFIGCSHGLGHYDRVRSLRGAHTSLAVVAPGIAEALFATAIRVVAAIPLLSHYNNFQGDVARNRRGWKGLPTNFPRFCHVKSISTPSRPGSLIVARLRWPASSRRREL